MTIRLLELFGGIGACTQALKRLGVDFEIADYVEIDKYAVKSYNAMNGTNFEPQDICKWDKDIEVDMIMHGSPCQDISLAGLQRGADEGSGTRSSLMYETLRIVKKLKPRYVIWENVANLVSERHFPNFQNYLNRMADMGYASAWKVLNTKDYGVPQNRERVFTVSVLGGNSVDLFGNQLDFNFPEPILLTKCLKDLLEKKVDEKYYLSDKMIEYISATGTENFKNNNSKINLKEARTVTTEEGNKRAGTSTYIGDDLPDDYDLNEPFRENKEQNQIGLFDCEEW